MSPRAREDGVRADPSAPLQEWHGETVAAWRSRWGVPDLRIYATVGSTNDVARALAEDGAPTGTVVIADVQTAGRGRRGRPWAGGAGLSLLLSFVLRPAHDAAAVLPLRIGLAAARGIEEETGVRPGIKWPNDLLADGRKLGGILCEGAVEGGRSAFIVAGIGLNVLQSDDDWPADLRDTATSLAAVAGATVSLPGLAGHLVREVSIAAGAGPRLSEEELRELETRDVLRGRPVTVDGRPAGLAAGIDDEGALRVQRDGATFRILTGTVRAENGAPRSENV